MPVEMAEDVIKIRELNGGKKKNIMFFRRGVLCKDSVQYYQKLATRPQ